MSHKALVKISAVVSILVALTVLYFYSRGVLPLTDVYVAKNEFLFYLVYGLISILGVFLFLHGRKRKNRALIIVSVLFVIGFPLLFYAVFRAPWDYPPHRLAMIGRGLIPALFLWLGILASAGYRWSHGILMAVFAALGIYHIVLAVKMIAGGGGAFSRVKTGDLVTALAIALISLTLVFVNYRSLKKG